MQTNLSIFLKEVANRDELKGNKLAWVVANYPDIDRGDKKRFYESLIRFYPISEDVKLKPFEVDTESELKEQLIFQNRDYRIKSFTLGNIRGIPKFRDNIPYGVDLSTNKEINHAIFLGSNGSGKSSIYEALEYLYCQRIGEAELRTSRNNIQTESDYFKKYLSHFDDTFENAFCQVDTIEGVFDIHNKPIFPENFKAKINPDTHFISDFDIYQKGQLDYESSNDKSFHFLIARSLGLEKFLEFNKLINEFVGYRRNTEVTNRDKLEKEQRSLGSNIDKWNIELKKRIKQIKELDKLNESQKAQIDFSKIIATFENAKNSIYEPKTDNIRLETVLARFYNTFNKYKEKASSDIKTNEIEFLSLGQDLLKSSSNCPLCENSKSDVNEIGIHITNRLKAIQEISQLRKDVKQFYEEVLSYISEIRSYLINYRSKIKIENDSTISIPAFNELNQCSVVFSSNLKLFLEEDFLVSINDIILSESSSESSFDKLFELILNNKEFSKTFENKFNTLFISYSKQRRELLEKIGKVIDETKNLSKPQEQRILLNKEKEDFEQQIKIANTRIKVIDKELIEANKKVVLYKSIKDESVLYAKVINQEINNIVNKSFEPIRDIVTKILQDYMRSDNVALSVEKVPDKYDNETGEVLSEFIAIKLISANGIGISPNKYFNTFRFRLFCMMVGISVAIASRNLTKINLPIFLDDVFYASDFEKRNSIISFIENLFKIFDDYSELPFQLILFTHDELIFDSILTALSNIDEDNNTFFGKLLPVDQAEKHSSYWELTYRMPNALPEFITKELQML